MIHIRDGAELVPLLLAEVIPAQFDEFMQRSGIRRNAAAQLLLRQNVWPVQKSLPATSDGPETRVDVLQADWAIGRFEPASGSLD